MEKIATGMAGGARGFLKGRGYYPSSTGGKLTVNQIWNGWQKSIELPLQEGII
jgi:hypothetical protein